MAKSGGFKESNETRLELNWRLSYVIDERRLVFTRKLLYHDNVVLRTLASLSAVYYEYISLCSQYDIKDPLSSRMYIKESVWNAFCNRVF